MVAGSLLQSTTSSPVTPMPTPHPDATVDARGAAADRFRAYRASGDRELRNALIAEHRWLAIHCAKRFTDKCSRSTTCPGRDAGVSSRRALRPRLRGHVRHLRRPDHHGELRPLPRDTPGPFSAPPCQGLQHTARWPWPTCPGPRPSRRRRSRGPFGHPSRSCSRPSKTAAAIGKTPLVVGDSDDGMPTTWPCSVSRTRSRRRRSHRDGRAPAERAGSPGAAASSSSATCGAHPVAHRRAVGRHQVQCRACSGPAWPSSERSSQTLPAPARSSVASVSTTPGRPRAGIGHEQLRARWRRRHPAAGGGGAGRPVGIARESATMQPAYAPTSRSRSGPRSSASSRPSASWISTSAGGLDYPGRRSRVASNVVVGIGFLGAGVIFRQGNTIGTSPPPPAWGVAGSVSPVASGMSPRRPPALWSTGQTSCCSSRADLRPRAAATRSSGAWPWCCGRSPTPLP